MADVVVIGGGSAGCVVASRLAEDEGRSVLLLEAGPGYSSVADCPVPDHRTLPVGPASPWVARYPVELAKGIHTRAVRGRLLGGSGAVNGAYFVRAAAEDFQEWPDSWSYANVLPYFVRMEHDHDFGGAEHGSEGPMPVRRRTVSELDDISAAFVSAALDMGYPMEGDKNANGPAGVGPVPLNISGGRRVSSAIAYLLPALDSSNLTVVDGTFVNRVLFSGGRVSGVEVVRDGVRRTVRTGRVVLAAGPIESPLLLMRSGVGNRKMLRQNGIRVIADLAGVGRSASDHPEVLVPYRVKGDVSQRRSAVLEVALNTQDIEIRPYTADFDMIVPGSNVRERSLGVGLMRPRSRGNIRMVSPDPRVNPVIEYHYLESEEDRDVLLDGVDTARRLLGSPSLRSLVDRIPVGDDEWLRERLATSQHLSGTCRMGDDENAVVDEGCRVRGVDGLWVADSSVLPVVPSRGPHATTIMVGERVAEFVRDQ